MWTALGLIFIGLTGWLCLSSLNDFNSQNIHPHYRKTPRRKRKIIHDTTVDYAQIKSLMDARLSGHLSDSQMLNLPTKVGSILILALVEKQLLKVSIGLTLTWASYSTAANPIKKDRSSAELFSIIEALYEELDSESKFEMMPLFYSPTMNSNASIYLWRTECRDAAFSLFEKLLDRDRLSVETLKREYLLAHKYHHLLPLHDKFSYET